MAQPFTWGFGGQQITSPEQAARQRAVAEALINRSSTPASNWAEGLGDITSAITGTVLSDRVSSAEEEGRRSAAAALAGLGPNSDFSSVSSALANPWLSGPQSQVASALLSQNLERQDPAYQLDMQIKQAQLEKMLNPVGENPYLNVGGGSIFNTGTGEFMTAPGVGGTDLPNDVKEYNWYAEQEAAAGREPLPYLDFVNAQKGAGLSVTTNPDGTTVVSQGGPGKLTEAQGKDVVYYTRGLDANSMLNGVEQNLTDWGQQNAGKIPMGLGNYLREPEFRQAKIAADAFLTAVLRKDTGAAITDQEFEIYGPIFLPVPGDDPATIQTKRRMRDVALLAIKGGLGTADAIAKANAEVLGVDPNAPVRPSGMTPSSSSPAGPASGVIDWTDL